MEASSPFEGNSSVNSSGNTSGNSSGNSGLESKSGLGNNNSIEELPVNEKYKKLNLSVPTDQHTYDEIWALSCERRKVFQLLCSFYHEDIMRLKGKNSVYINNTFYQEIFKDNFKE